VLIYEKQNPTAPLVLTLEREDEGGITGAVPTFAVRDATTLDSYLDFDDFTFKSSGWGTKYEPLTEVESGDYTYWMNLNAMTSISIGDILSVEYYYDDGVATNPLREQETMMVVESINNIPTDTAALVGGGGGNLTPAQATQLQEVWQILGLDIANPMVVSKNTRKVDLIDQTIQQNVPFAGHITVTRL
jgi:hypothetical protein